MACDPKFEFIWLIPQKEYLIKMDKEEKLKLTSLLK
jgi:hypothetical protein